MPFTARIERPSSFSMILPSLLVLFSRKGGLIGLPLRVSNEGLPRPRVARAQETIRLPFSSLQARSLSLQGWGLIDLPLRASNEGLLRPRVARAQKIIRLHPLFCSGSKGSARVSFHPFHRARSASKKGTWPLLPHPSETARCASTGDHLVCPLILLPSLHVSLFRGRPD
jgi:hypothetical protein